MKQLFLIVIITILSFSCNNSNKEAAMQTPEPAKQEETNKYKADTSGYASGNGNTTDEKKEATKKENWEKKIIRTADIRIEVKNYSKYNNSIRSNIKNFGAYIDKEEQTQTDGVFQNTITIKVPVEKFEDLVNSINGDDINIIDKRINSEDVTAEVVDTKARMEAKKQVRLQYLELLKQAKNIKDILEIQKEINNIQEDIEAAASRVNYLTHSAAYSTINLTYYEYNTNLSNNYNGGFIFKVKNAFINSIKLFEQLILAAINIWPIIIGIVVVLWAWRKKKKSKTKNI